MSNEAARGDGRLKPVTPGELLAEEFLKPLEITQSRLAQEIGAAEQHILEIVDGQREVTADIDLRLCRYFGLSDGFWLRAQIAQDLELARSRMQDELDRITPMQPRLP